MTKPLIRVTLDACVLANYSLCDTLLRLAEHPQLYEPIWSDEILRETTRTLELKLGWPPPLVQHFESQLRTHFCNSSVRDFERLIPMMTNEEKDRHVTAAAVHGGAPLILTFNLRHFRREHLEPWALEAQHPQDFLIRLWQLDPELVLTKLRQQAKDRNRSLARLLQILSATTPTFAALIGAGT